MILIKDRHSQLFNFSNIIVPGKYDTYKGSTLALYNDITMFIFLREI